MKCIFSLSGRLFVVIYVILEDDMNDYMLKNLLLGYADKLLEIY